MLGRILPRAWCSLSQCQLLTARLYAPQHGLAAGLERSCFQHEAWTWDLMRLLFEALLSESDDAAEAGGSSGDAGQGQHRFLAALERRAALSRWLQVHSLLPTAIGAAHYRGHCNLQNFLAFTTENLVPRGLCSLH